MCLKDLKEIERPQENRVRLFIKCKKKKTKKNEEKNKPDSHGDTCVNVHRTFLLTSKRTTEMRVYASVASW